MKELRGYVVVGGMAGCHASVAEIQDLEERRILEAEGERAADLNPQFDEMMFHSARNRYLLSSFEELVLITLGPTTLEIATRIERVFTEYQEIIHGLMTRDEVLSGRGNIWRFLLKIVYER